MKFSIFDVKMQKVAKREEQLIALIEQKERELQDLESLREELAHDRLAFHQIEFERSQRQVS